MPPPMSPSTLSHFAALEDPRQHAKVLYPLVEVLLLALSATVAGAGDFVETTIWGEENQAFLRRFFPYQNGIPSHDTLCDAFAAIDPELFKSCFLTWVEDLRDGAPETIAIDGKTSRRSDDRGKGRKPLHMVSAWATRQRIVLGREATEEKSNEITAIPRLLKSLDLQGAVVTIDAMGTQTRIAQTIRDGGGYYVLSLKENWPATFAEIALLFDRPPPGPAFDTSQTVDGGGGQSSRVRSARPHRRAIPQREGVAFHQQLDLAGILHPSRCRIEGDAAEHPATRDQMADSRVDARAYDHSGWEPT
jgi:hypothetical protein